MSVYELEPNQELRIQVGDESIKLELKKGLAEVYGTEMLVNKTYTFLCNSKAAVFTYQGATIEIFGNPFKCHVGKKCNYYIDYLNLHGELEKMREEGLKTPICLICKPMHARNVGKSTLCRILLNYAARRGRTPIFVDLDPDQGHIGLPGTIGALSIESPIDIETGLVLKSQQLLHFGYTALKGDSEGKSCMLYQALLENMANIVHSKLEQDKKSFNSGVIINTSAWSDDGDYKTLIYACKVFKANMVLVMDDEVLRDDLEKDLENVEVLNVPRTVGLVSNVELRYQRIKQYFYGTDVELINPMTSEIHFKFLKNKIYRLGNPLMLQDSLLPLGTKAKDENRIEVSPYECRANDLLHHILAVSYCKIDEVQKDPQSLLKYNVMGFVCVTSVRNDDLLNILTPQKLPNPMEYVLLYSEVQYVDSI